MCQEKTRQKKTCILDGLAFTFRDTKNRFIRISIRSDHSWGAPSGLFITTHRPLAPDGGYYHHDVDQYFLLFHWHHTSHSVVNI